jgi:hypothetical protein
METNERTEQYENIEMFRGEVSACDHFVQIYEDDRAFIDTLEGFIGGGLRGNDAAIVIVTLPHRQALEARMSENGIDVAAVIQEGRYVVLDAQETLSKFMIKDWPDDDRFATVIGSIISRAKANGRNVRAFGEMVALLWAQGHGAATVRLEYLWNELCRRESFALFCAYPKACFTQNAAESVAHVSATHSRVILP